MRKLSFYSKCVRSFFLPSRPVLCHFFVTERCNNLQKGFESASPSLLIRHLKSFARSFGDGRP